MFLIIFSIAIYFAGFLAILLMRRARETAFGWTALACAGGSFFSLLALWMTQELPHEFLVRDIDLLGVSARFGFIADELSLLGSMIVSGIAFLVLLFAQDYMRDDPSKWRFFAEMCLFAGSMIGILLAASLLQMFVFWELVGLSSYLLIGFWYAREEVAKAAQKVFTLIMAGDVLLLAGIILLGGDIGSMNFEDIVQARALGEHGRLAVLLILLGALVKSAQVPFFFWLPWAMEGPTPVSALLHAATMVKAGVFLVLRLWPIVVLVHFEDLLLAVAFATVFVASFAALAERDIKRVLAYSTVSQLGFMFLALGLGNPHVSLFHLMNDAFYKALLFVGAGVFMHLGHQRDLFMLAKFNRKRNMVFLALTAVGVLGIAGVPPLGGFFSKDAILEGALERGTLVFALTLCAAFLTSVYISRWFLLVWRAVAPSLISEKNAHAAESHNDVFGVKTKIAMAVLACGVLGSGFAGRQFFSEFFYGHHIPPLNFGIILVSVAAIAGAFALSFLGYIKGKPIPAFFATLWGGLPYRAALYGFGFAAAADGISLLALRVSSALAVLDRRVIDRIIGAAVLAAQRAAFGARFLDRSVIDPVLDRGIAAFVALCRGIRIFDWKVIDGAVREIAVGFQIFAQASRLLVSGLLSRYLAAFAFGTVALIIFFIFLF